MVGSVFPVVSCRDLDVSRDFYCELLGLVTEFESGWYTVVRSASDPSARLGFVAAGHESVPACVTDQAAGVLISVIVPDVDEVHDTAVEMGVEIVWSLRDEPFGQRHFMASDQNSLVIDVITPIPPTRSFLREVAQWRRATTETVEVGTVATPWATDANQAPVPTHFTVDGTTLTQHIKHTNTEYAYPIVADPKFSKTWYGMHTIKLTSYELGKLTNAMIYGGGVFALVCTGSTAGLCALPTDVVVALLATIRGSLGLCSNSKGVDIHFTAVPQAIWCSGY